MQRRYPGNLDVLLHAARLERSSGNYAEALRDLRQARQLQGAAEPLPGADALALQMSPTLSGIERDINAIEARRQAWIELAQTNYDKESTDGISSLRGWTRPLVAWLPWNYDGRVFVHADQVQLDAGPLPASASDASSFGQVAAWDPTLYNPATPQSGSALNVGVGYVGETLQWDIGQIGLGFPVSNVVGGVRINGDLGPYGYALNLSRRALTGSLLSYAGAYDPVTGAVWGGVVATGVGARLSRDVGPVSLSASTQVSALTGVNVADNSRLSWRLAGDMDVWSNPDQNVNAGLALSGLHHARDLSGTTWGQGGYYSPVRNITLSLPLQWDGRKGTFSWLVRGSVALADSFSSATDYYPTSAALQAQSGYQVNASSSGSSIGYSFNGVAEYQASRQWAVGASLEREVSDYYTPLSLMLYTRLLFEPVRQPVPRRPQVPQAYVDF